MRKKLLLADDSVTIQKVVGISFANEDVELVTVDNGDDAIARARQVKPDVVLADVVMPGKNGYEVCEALKAIPELASVPVLLLTGTFEAFDNARAERCGAAGHIAKPFEAQVLVDRVRQLLTRPPAPPAPAPAPAAPAADDGATVAIGRVSLGRPGSATSAPEDAAQNADSFDFFDDALGDAPATQSAQATRLDLDPSDSAFAFAAEVDAPSAREIPPPPATPVPAAIADAQLADGLLMDDDDLPSSDGLVDLDDGFVVAPMAPSEDTLARFVSDEADSSDIFDFASDEGAVGDPLGAESFGQETVLDPQGASGYDVSSSDLGAPQALPPVGMGDSDFPADLRPLAELPPIEADEPSSGDTLDAPAVATTIDESSLEDVGFADLSWAGLGGHESSEPELDDDEPRRVPTSHGASSIAGIALAEIEPRLREDIHDTLEKIAWESLGNVAEQVIRQAVEQIERAAWEVIPQLAEALIKEEIRRMKGE